MTMPDPDRWKRISPLLDELLDLGPAERRVRLEAMKAAEPDVGRELEALLGSASQSRWADFLDGQADVERAPGHELAGRQIGAYVIETALGQGGTGSVWRARRADGRFEGKVAVKLLHLSLIGRTGALRFEREGGILARLTHPNIARLLDAGVTPDGQPYLVLELVEGQRIDRYCDACRLTVEQRLALFDRVLEAVAHAHSHLVIHRDIKPNNILVTPEGEVKLLDFGIAKLLQDETEAAPITVEGRRALTPEYAAPEQLQGGEITTATDVYALGVLLYQLLAGRHPTAADTATSAEVMRATIDIDPVRLGESLSGGTADGDFAARLAADRDTSVALLRRQLGGDLENIVDQALRKIPSERYRTVAALADDLHRYLAHEPVSARPDSLTYRCAKFVRRNRGAVAAGLLVGGAILAGVVGTISQAHRAETQAELARHERDRAQRELANVEAVDEFMTFLLASQADRPMTASELLLRGETLARQQFASDPGLRARLQLTLSGITSELDEQERTLALLRDARTAADRSGDVGLQSAIACSIAVDLSGEPDARRAAAMFATAIDRVSSGPDADRATHAMCMHQRAIRALEAGDARAAAVDGRAALEMLGTPRPGQRTLALAMRTNLAGALAKSGDLPAGIDETRRAIAELDAMGQGRTVGAATVHNNLSVLLMRAGNSLAALGESEKAASIYGEQTADAGIPVPLLLNQAQHLLAVGRQQEAVAIEERARMLAVQRGDTRTPAYGASGFVFCPFGQANDCEARIADARKVLSGFLPPGHATFATLETTLGELALQRGDAETARSALRRGLAIFDANPTPQPMRTRAAALLAEAEMSLGHADAATASADEAVAQAREIGRGFAHTEWLGRALLAQGIVRDGRGDHGSALAAWREALVELHETVGDAAPPTRETRRRLGTP